MSSDPQASLDGAFDALRRTLKQRDVEELLASRGTNTSLAQVALDGLAHYLAGRRDLAGEDFATVAEEIQHRASLARLTTAPDDTP